MGETHIVIEVDSEVGPVLASYAYDRFENTIEIVMMRQCGYRTYADHYSEDFLRTLDDLAWQEIHVASQGGCDG